MRAIERVTLSGYPIPVQCKGCLGKGTTPTFVWKKSEQNEWVNQSGFLHVCRYCKGTGFYFLNNMRDVEKFVQGGPPLGVAVD